VVGRAGQGRNKKSERSDDAAKEAVAAAKGACDDAATANAAAAAHLNSRNIKKSGRVGKRGPLTVSAA
jgi:hypothetical protein